MVIYKCDICGAAIKKDGEITLTATSKEEGFSFYVKDPVFIVKHLCKNCFQDLEAAFIKEADK